MRRGFLRLAPLLAAAWLAAPGLRAEPLVLSLPPFIEAERGATLMEDFLSLVAERTGAGFALARHDNAFSYMDNLEDGRFDLVFEGPHVLALLAEQGVATPLAEFRHTLSYVVVVPREDAPIYELRDLAGKPVCVGPSPDPFALELTASIGNPTREPVLVAVADHRRRIRQLLGGQCRAATLQTTRFLTLEDAEGADELRIIYKSADLPGFGAAVNTRVDGEVAGRIAAVLTSAEGAAALRALAVALFGDEAPMMPASAARLRELAARINTYVSW